MILICKALPRFLLRTPNFFYRFTVNIRPAPLSYLNIGAGDIARALLKPGRMSASMPTGSM